MSFQDEAYTKFSSFKALRGSFWAFEFLKGCQTVANYKQSQHSEESFYVLKVLSNKI